MLENRDAPPLPGESTLTVAHRSGRVELSGRREIDKLMARLGTVPRILCWKCRKLTSFELDRCQHCGSPFAGSTGGAYQAGRTASPRTISLTEDGPEPPARNLSEIVEDLQRVREVSTRSHGRKREQETSVNLYQCPSCGRFVSEAATDCVCGVRFAGSTTSVFACPECGSHVPEDVNICPVCSVAFEPARVAGSIAYACPRCGVHVASDAVRCSCGVWFAD